MRSRNIKPGFFLNDKLAEVDFGTRLLFTGLWCYADREGRFEWIPKRIKAAIFPYDDKVNIDKMLCNLMSLHVITKHDNVGYVENFKKHQNPHPHEAKSVLPEKPQQNQCHDMSVTLQGMSGECNADSLIPDSLIPDSLIPDSLIPDIRNPNKPKPFVADFDIFYTAYPKHEGKDAAKKAWNKIKPDAILFSTMLSKIAIAKNTEAWQKEKGKFIPLPATWLNGKRWEDESAPLNQGGNKWVGLSEKNYREGISEDGKF